MSEWTLPFIDMTRCNGCGLCVEYCPTHAVELEKGRPVIISPADCAYCGLCEETCPVGAIALVYEIETIPHSGGKDETTDRPH